MELFKNLFMANTKNHLRKQILERWVIYSSDTEATKINSDWFHWMHYTTDKIPDKKISKYSWQKKHLENQTGTVNKFKPVKIRKDSTKKKYETWK